MALMTMYEYANKIGMARVTVRLKISEYDIKPVGAVKIGSNKCPSYLYDEIDLNTLVFYEKAGRPNDKQTTRRKNV